MMQVNDSDDTLVSEEFSPYIGDGYKAAYAELLTRISNALAINRDELIQNEIDRVREAHQETNTADWDTDTLKYLAVLHVLMDLSKQGWLFQVNGVSLVLQMDNGETDDKSRIRYRLSAERNAQFKVKSVQGFIRSLEKVRNYKGKSISIKDLIGDPEILKEKILDRKQVCDPYIQLVTNERDEFTGYKLSDVWRYFRYTWSIPYKTMPGRNLFYLVRDRLQPAHPVIGIFALGNSVLNLAVRDDDIGWTVDSIKRQLMQKRDTSYCDQIVKRTEGRTVKVKIDKAAESEKEHNERARSFADRIYPLLLNNLDKAIDDIYIKDLNCEQEIEHPDAEFIAELTALAEDLSRKALNNKNGRHNPDWEREAKTTLFKRKRAAELAKLLSAKRVFQEACGEGSLERLMALLSTEEGRRAVNTALIANRKYKIGSNMMEIIVCGAIPPYNELLGGKLISILACSPVVIRDCTKKYERQVSEIASRMKGEEVIRDSRLAFLGTTSLYSSGSSQYNRIKVPLLSGGTLEYRKMGITEGYGTVYFSSETTLLFSAVLERMDGGKKINHVFGEGTSPRFRLISRGLRSIGIKAEAFLRHYSPRIVYSIDLAKNTKEFLMGLTEELDYGFDLNDDEQIARHTQYLIDFWYHRWLEKRLTTVDIVGRLEHFRVEDLLLSSLL